MKTKFYKIMGERLGVEDRQMDVKPALAQAIIAQHKAKKNPPVDSKSDLVCGQVYPIVQEDLSGRDEYGHIPEYIDALILIARQKIEEQSRQTNGDVNSLLAEG